MKNFLVKFLASGAYAGYSPVAPGTVGTLWGAAIVFFLKGVSPYSYAAITAAVTLASIYLAGQAIEIYAKKDPPHVVCDEISGYLVSFFLMPFSFFNIILLFLLFRIFDILKPYPAGAIDERLPGGAGVVLDDVASGVYANIAAHLIIWFIKG
ncbi:MAG: phosphatidylglycerophosphatase A [Deltaproteobacteria bacterium]|nr:phosphatidylglycerophosphatase A [Deltaproteobacteria bacterium]